MRAGYPWTACPSNVQVVREELFLRPATIKNGLKETLLGQPTPHFNPQIIWLPVRPLPFLSTGSAEETFLVNQLQSAPGHFLCQEVTDL